jgi:hypothetical protein
MYGEKLDFSSSGRMVIAGRQGGPMFLGITVIGWVLLITIYLPISILILGKFHRARWIPLAWKVPALAFAAAILWALPVTDAALSTWKLNNLCPESGLKVYRREVVEGFYDENISGGFLTGSGYRFREYFDSAKRSYVRAELSPFGGITYQVIPMPTARYHFKKWEFSDLGFGVKRSERRIYDSLTRRDLAVEISVGRYPGFVDRLWLRWFGPMEGLETCFRKGQEDIVMQSRNILIPIDKK